MNWLPPDNSQLALRIEVAQRTSPTNIGLWLTSALAARDFGYLTPDDFWRRCSQTMTTLERLERYEGHLLNWYDTRTLRRLEPRYVSTADSGNLLACLWVLEQGCHDTLHAPLLGHQSLRGLADTLSVLREACESDPLTSGPHDRSAPPAAREGGGLRRHRPAAPGARADPAIAGNGARRRRWLLGVAPRSRAAILDRNVDLYLKWMETLMRAPEATVRVLGEQVGSCGAAPCAQFLR